VCLGRSDDLLAFKQLPVCGYFVRVKSILGRSHKVNESIKDPFKYETWLGSVHDGLRVIVKGMTTA